jgi:hypothetical protein
VWQTGTVEESGGHVLSMAAPRAGRAVWRKSRIFQKANGAPIRIKLRTLMSLKLRCNFLALKNGRGEATGS